MAITTGAALIGGAVVGAAGSIYAAKKGAEGSEEAAEIAAGAQGASLEYLKEVEKLPRALREEALRGLGAEAGYTFDEQGNIISDQTTLEERALASPLYTRAKGEGAEAVMRYGSMTGGLRSGNTIDDIYTAESDLFQRSYQNQQNIMSGLAGLPSYASEIAGVTSGIGATQAAGVMGAAQAQQQGYQGVGAAITGGIDNYLKYQRPPPPQI